MPPEFEQSHSLPIFNEIDYLNGKVDALALGQATNMWKLADRLGLIDLGRNRPEISRVYAECRTIPGLTDSSPVTRLAVLEDIAIYQLHQIREAFASTTLPDSKAAYKRAMLTFHDRLIEDVIFAHTDTIDLVDQTLKQTPRLPKSKRLDQREFTEDEFEILGWLQSLVYKVQDSSGTMYQDVQTLDFSGLPTPTLRWLAERIIATRERTRSVESIKAHVTNRVREHMPEPKPAPLEVALNAQTD